jgi:hypothetical protein
VRRLLLLLLVLPALPGCGYGLTALMWNAQRSRPVGISDAVLTPDATLFADVETTVGPLRLLKVADVSDDMMQIAEARGPLPPGRAVTIREQPLDSADPESFASGAWLWLGPDGHTDGQLVLAVRSGTRFRENSVWYRRPIDFSRWQAWGAVVATPVTVVLDLVVIGPTEVIWSIFTLGQHGTLYPFNEP